MDRFHEEIEAGQGRCESRQNSRLESTEQRHYHDRGVIQNVVVSKAEQGFKSNTGSCCDAYAHQRESVTSGPSSQPVRGDGNSSRSIGKTHSQPQEKVFGSLLRRCRSMNGPGAARNRCETAPSAKECSARFARILGGIVEPTVIIAAGRLRVCDSNHK